MSTNKNDGNTLKAPEQPISFQTGSNAIKPSKLKIIVIVCTIATVVVIALSILIVLLLMNLKNNDNSKENSSPTFIKETTVAETTIAETTVPLKKEILLNADNELGYVFNLTFEEFIESYNKAIHEFQFDNLNTINSNDFKSQNIDGNVYGINNPNYYKANTISLMIDTETKKVFYIDIRKETENFESELLILIKVINPSVSLSQAESIMNNAMNGTVISNYSAVLKDNICYYVGNFITEENMSIALIPMTEDYYNSRILINVNETSSDNNNSNLSYVVEDFGHFYADVPKNWIYEVENGAIYFYEEYNFNHDETGSKGYLCDIIGIDPQNSDTLSPNAKYIGGTDTIDYYVEFPMGSGIIEDETASQKMQVANNQLEDFIDSIIFK